MLKNINLFVRRESASNNYFKQKPAINRIKKAVAENCATRLFTSRRLVTVVKVRLKKFTFSYF